MDKKQLQIFITIAEFCGIDIEEYRMEDGSINTAPLPDYFNKLDDIAVAERLLSNEQSFDYFYNLNDAVGLVNPHEPSWIKEFCAVALATATATERTIALYHTIKA